MAPHEASTYSAFHGREAATDAAPPIGKMQSVGNLLRALWKNRQNLGANGVAAAKDVIPDMPLDDPIAKRLSNEVMHMLWGSMLHPPSSYRGAKFQYRSADGSNNSMINPDLGKAGLPYAKSVQAQRPVNAAKPDVGDLFDLLMARDDDGRESETGISSLLLYQATIVIHDVFRTNDKDRNISDTSSYLDLSPLYGKDHAAQMEVRTRTNGLLKKDTFAEHRLLNQPPGVSIFLIMYNRFHNYVAKQLLEINENGRFTLPADFKTRPKALQTEALNKRDEDLFQTARLITCGLYAQIAIHDYLRCLMMMHGRDTAWTLDPRREYNGLIDKETVARGQGNMVSVEFNLLYRFHSALSQRDAQWSTDLFRHYLEGPEGAGLTEEQIKNGDIPVPMMAEMLRKMNAMFEQQAADRAKIDSYFPIGFDNVGAKKGEFVFKRGPDGYFDDAQMVAELVRCMEDPMCSFGFGQIPKVFKSIEMLGILQSRKWEVCTLNEFRRFFGMAPHMRFEDINSDCKIQDRLRDIYVDVENVELYPGYLCEGQGRDTDPNTSCPTGATALWRGIFSDAVTLVRSDRFYTAEWNVDGITAYGMREVTSDPTINKGGLLYKLCQRAFPGYFKYNSLHLWEPYYTTAKNLVYAYEQNKLKDLDFDGLEFQFQGDKDWAPLTLKRNSEGTIEDAFFKKVKAEPRKLRVRRKLEPTQDQVYGWRGREAAQKVTTPSQVIGSNEGPPADMSNSGDYAIIKKEILGGEDGRNWANPAIVAAYDLPKGPLRQILTNQYDEARWMKARTIFAESLGSHADKMDTAVFRKYFAAVADQIRKREQREFQKTAAGQVYQLDIVSDYAIPIITQLFADWLGFWHRIKTVEHPNREFSENAIYELMDNCQDYQSWDADQTKGMKRRQLFQSSIRKLKALADDGVVQSSYGLLFWRNMFRTYGSGTDPTAVLEVRKLAVKATQNLLWNGYSYDEVASLMLQFALDSAHKLVLNFTEVLAFFIDPVVRESGEIGAPGEDWRTTKWREIQTLARLDTPEADSKILKYVLEAQRLTPTINLARQYVGTAGTTIETTVKGTSCAVSYPIRKGDVVLLDIHAANHNSKVFPSPEKFDITRPVGKYLIYGDVIDINNQKQAAPLAKQLALAYLTTLIKHVSTMRAVRVAHESLGRLKRVRLPGNLPGYPAKDVLTRYASPQWDMLLPFPATWEIRYTGMYDGTGEGVYFGGNNANQGHGMDQIWQDNELSSALEDANSDDPRPAPQPEPEVAKATPLVSWPAAAAPKQPVQVTTVPVPAGDGW